MKFNSCKLILSGAMALALFAANPATAEPAAMVDDAEIETGEAASDEDWVSEENIVPEADATAIAEEELTGETPKAENVPDIADNVDGEAPVTEEDALPDGGDTGDAEVPEEILEENPAPAKENKRWWGRPY